MEQIITEDGQIVDDLDKHIERIGLPEIGTDYHVASIIGCQSSGKSTLLNLLFGTKFETMDEKRGRQQTTKGIHAAIAQTQPLLIFDVEGCDSRERGDADSLFERKSSLFALALSEVMIVNMWESDIGRYNAANLPMLKTVFEVNIQLFQAQVNSKTTLFFLIRDYTTDNFQALSENIIKDMNNIWKEIHLPEQYQNSQISDFFDMRFYAIHHMKIQRDVFNKDVENLKGWFLDPNNENYLFKQHSGKNVPGDGLAQYIAQLWNVIYENKELNIPSQRSMLSHFKCEENVKMLVSDIVNELTDPLNAPLKKKEIVTNFREICEPPIAKAFSIYKDNTWRYLSDVVEEKRNDMISEISNFLYPLFTKNGTLISSRVFEDFVHFISKQGPEFVEGGHWSSDVETEIDRALSEMSNQIDQMKFPPFVDLWTFDTNQTRKEMTDFIDNQRSAMTASLHLTIISSVLHSFTERANEIIKESSDQMWIQLRQLMQEKSNEAENKIKAILSTNAPNEPVNPDIHKEFDNQALALVKEAATYILLKMKGAFDKQFKYDNGRPRVWTKDDDVTKIFEQAKRAGENVLRLFTFCHLVDPNKPCDPNNPLNQILIDNNQIEEIQKQYNRIVIHTYEEARGLIKAQMAQDQIPPYAWIFLFFLGGDKIVKWMSNPLFFTFTLFFGGAYFMLKQLGLWEVVLEAAKEKFYSIRDELLNKADEMEEEEDEADDVEHVDNDTPDQNQGLQDMDLSKPLDTLVIPKVRDVQFEIPLPQNNIDLRIAPNPSRKANLPKRSASQRMIKGVPYP